MEPSRDVQPGHPTPSLPEKGDAEGPAGPDAPSRPPLPSGVVRVRERRRRVGDLEIHTHPGWEEAFPWLVQGVTGRKAGGEDGEPFDLGLFAAGATGPVMERWARLGDALAMPRIVHGRQVHGAAVRLHDGGAPGLEVSPDTDGHVTRTPGTLLTVATADCVGVSLVDPVRRAVALLHAGWRGVAAGVLERGLAVLAGRLASRAGDLHVHLGPAICGRCYEVGPEVHEALGLGAPAGPTPVDLRAVVARRAVDAGVEPGRITVSSRCTRCGGSPFFSHRGGCRERQVGFVGVAP